MGSYLEHTHGSRYAPLVVMLLGLVLDQRRARYWLPLGILVRVIYYGALRPGEGLALQVKGVALPSDAIPRFKGCGVLRIDRPKNRRYMGRRQMTIIEDPVTLAWLGWLCEAVPDSATLWPSTPARFRALFKEALLMLGAGGCGFSLASLRAGRATDIFREVRDVNALKFLGRWKSVRSLEAYIQETMAAMVAIDLAPAVPMVTVLGGLAPLVASPPGRRWEACFSRDRQYAGLLREKRRLVSRLRDARGPGRDGVARF